MKRSSVYDGETRRRIESRTISILLVDHQAILRKGLRALVDTRPGWKIVGEAGNGLDAIERAHALQPDLVIADIAMPELNGLDAIPKILKVSPRTRILIFSSHNEEELISRAMNAGAQAYVLKSDAEQAVLNAIEAVLSDRTFVSAAVARRVVTHVQNRTNIEERNLALATLTQREREVVQLISEGNGNKQAADRLGISVRTVENHRARLMKKLGVGLCGLVRYAVRNNIIQA